MAAKNKPLDHARQHGDGYEQHHVPPAGRVIVVPHHHQVAQHGDGDNDAEVDAPGDDEEHGSHRAQRWCEDFDLYYHHDRQSSPGQIIDAEDRDEGVDDRVESTVQEDREDDGEVQDRRQRHDDGGARHQDDVQERGPPVPLFTSGTYQTGAVVQSGALLLVTLQVVGILQTGGILDGVRGTIRSRRHTVPTPPPRRAL